MALDGRHEIHCAGGCGRRVGALAVDDEAAWDMAVQAALDEDWSLEDQTGWGFLPQWYCPEHRKTLTAEP